MAENLLPLQNSHAATELEAELKDLFVKLWTDSLAETAADINVYGAPHLGSFGLVEKSIDREGLSVLRENTEARIRYLFRGWRHRNPERGMHFLRLYLTALFGDAWTMEQLWQRKSTPYPTELVTKIEADAEPGNQFFLTSRLRVDVDSTVVPERILASLRSSVAARILLTVRVGRTLQSGVGVAAVHYAWHVYRAGMYGIVAAPPSARRAIISEDGRFLITEVDGDGAIVEGSG